MKKNIFLIFSILWMVLHSTYFFASNFKHAVPQILTPIIRLINTETYNVVTNGSYSNEFRWELGDEKINFTINFKSNDERNNLLIEKIINLLKTSKLWDDLPEYKEELINSMTIDSLKKLGTIHNREIDKFYCLIHESDIDPHYANLNIEQQIKDQKLKQSLLLPITGALIIVTALAIWSHTKKDNTKEDNKQETNTDQDDQNENK